MDRITNYALDGIPGLQGVQKRTAHEAVLDRLRMAILRGELAPGTPLVLADLSAQLRVSRTPVREAMRDLAAEGLVDFDAYRSSIVHRPTLVEAREVYDLRLVLEPIAVREAVPWISPRDIKHAQAFHEAMLGTREVGEWVDLNRRFHAALMRPVHSGRLLSLLASLRDAAAIQVALSIKAHPDRLTGSNDEHDAILSAFREREVERAVELTELHLRSTLETIGLYEADREESSPG